MTILEEIEISPNKRPKYTSYELRSLVRKKRKQECLTIQGMAEKYQVELKILQDIEKSNRVFNVKMYDVCIKILEMSKKEILMQEEDELPNNLDTVPNEVRQTFDMANSIFQEAVIQEKIATK